MFSLIYRVWEAFFITKKQTEEAFENSKTVEQSNPEETKNISNNKKCQSRIRNEKCQLGEARLPPFELTALEISGQRLFQGGYHTAPESRSMNIFALPGHLVINERKIYSESSALCHPYGKHRVNRLIVHSSVCMI